MEWRLDKFLTQIPVGTRSQVKDMIKKGRVCVNGVHASKPELKVDPENDSITLDPAPRIRVRHLFLPR